ncbi:phage terminase large subunit family protein [Teichococcus aestuarii]|uniref:phage terminase large subunit family protein n=1 Tax=Teichococcus aestuarii TaxID=568898 RepID=UPI00361A568D
MESRKPTSPLPKTEQLFLSARKGWTPPPRISVPDWADKVRKLAKEAGSASGDWNTGTVEVARGPMLAVTEPGVHIITAMVSTQLLKTALLENVFGFHAHLDPCPMLLIQPKEAAAEQFSRERITPMVRATPKLRALVGSSKTRKGDESLLYKSFPGGFLALAGAGSPDNLARRPIRVLLCDEVDKYPVTREGDPIMLAEERTASFALNWLSLRVCSPTVEDESRIEASYKESDQRRASIACPDCSHRQFLDFFKHVDWEKDGGTHRPETARIYCEACRHGWSEGERLKALATIRHHQTRPFTCCGEYQMPLEAYERAGARRRSRTRTAFCSPHPRRPIRSMPSGTGGPARAGRSTGPSAATAAAGRCRTSTRASRLASSTPPGRRTGRPTSPRSGWPRRATKTAS